MIDDEIRKLFRLRDKAVKNKDINLFLSTQVSEIRNSSAKGYLSVDELKSKVIYIFTDSNKIRKSAAVEESYYYQRKLTHKALLLYYLVHTPSGWKVYDIVW
ncbi:hypothetical protein A2160_03100 [Candidatus Beckwithbacteria bacterium RBG_13_42_9]|uniref:Tim44-like domain-containing protein n=1 Tax=Candidatus Beckwithbacteria bacterium RBG_13_42_9 TaxID=1797457 RepID=A0A1F5E7Z3_9BACT|nr:MAG: hypothetical protein A2160_03100 [Candidatus Beckwithbacteria bacterium RBG_13_42_9]